MKPCKNVCHYEISDSFENGHVVSKTRSLRQILEKLCIRSRGNDLCPIIMELGQNICPDKISQECENELCPVKN